MIHFKTVRHAMHLSQQEVADLLGVSQQAVARYEQPETEIPDSIQYLLESKLHVNLEFLNSGTGEMFTIPESIAQYKESYQQILKYVFQLDQEELQNLIEYLQSYEFKNI